MTITFVKPKPFEAKNVKADNIDIDENWKINHIEYNGVVKEQYNGETTNYKFSLQHKKTGINSENMILCLNFQNADTMQLVIKDDSTERYNYGRTVYGLKRHRNVYLILQDAVKDAEFIKAVFGMWRRTKLETTKKFGKIFRIQKRR